MYDAKSLTLQFKQHGFSNIHNLEYGISNYITDIRDVEGTKESYLSVYIEAKK